MNHKTCIGLFCSLMLFASACSTSRAASPAPEATHEVHGKPGAAVTVEAALTTQSAHVTVRFDAAAQDATVRVHGVDRLVVTDGASLDVGDVARGDVRELDVVFTPGAARSHLVVSVEGTYAGGVRSRVASFAVGEARPTSAARATGEGDDRVRLMPVQGR